MTRPPLTVIIPALTLCIATAAWAADYTVEWAGALRKVHHGDASAQLSLEQFADRPHFYAVGPLAEMEGEITAVDGKIHIARVRDGEIVTEHTAAVAASFLVWGEVREWRPALPLGVAVENHAQLEQRLEALAAEAGLDLDRPFPVRLEGVMEQVDYHVVVPRTSSHAPSDHLARAKKISLKNEPATVIGFFSKEHQGIFTHRGSFAHLHIIAANGWSGHIDEIQAGPEVMVSLPR